MNRWLLMLFVIGYAMLLVSCAQQRIGVQLFDPEVYTRAEVDAINAEKQCKQTARTQLEMARCTGNRRGP